MEEGRIYQAGQELSRERKVIPPPSETHLNRKLNRKYSGMIGKELHFYYGKTRKDMKYYSQPFILAMMIMVLVPSNILFLFNSSLMIGFLLHKGFKWRKNDDHFNPYYWISFRNTKLVTEHFVGLVDDQLLDRSMMLMGMGFLWVALDITLFSIPGILLLLAGLAPFKFKFMRKGMNAYVEGRFFKEEHYYRVTNRKWWFIGLVMILGLNLGIPYNDDMMVGYYMLWIPFLFRFFVYFTLPRDIVFDV